MQQPLTYDIKTTIKLAHIVQDRLKDYAKQQKRPMSSLLGDLVTQAASDLGLLPPTIKIIPKTGIPVLDVLPGQDITQEELLEFVDEDFDD